MNGKDTILLEEMKIFREADTLVFSASVKDQNEGMPVLFRQVPGPDGNLTFENKAHDFPQRIVYSHPHPDSLIAWIEGMDKGKLRKELFPMFRVKTKK